MWWRWRNGNKNANDNDDETIASEWKILNKK